MIDFTLYLITDRQQVPGGDLLSALEEALEGGVRAVQLRERDLTDRELYDLGMTVRVLTREYGAKLLINDRADIAAAVEADGVHLRQSSYSAREARRIVGKDALIGVSTHSLEQAKAAEAEGGDFVTFGPVFDTPSKRSYGPPLGLDRLDAACRELTVPVFAVGGIGEREVAPVLRAGAFGVALISAVLAGGDIRETAAGIMTELQRRGGTPRREGMR
ncbi:MAG: thiamine phosphate synthase [Deltaproteobacteria bacterium]|nr:thiamine phosphate synthase [Deltaproteobacteria bacterium]